MENLLYFHPFSGGATPSIHFGKIIVQFVSPLSMSLSHLGTIGTGYIPLNKISVCLVSNVSVSKYFTTIFSFCLNPVTSSLRPVHRLSPGARPKSPTFFHQLLTKFLLYFPWILHIIKIQNMLPLTDGAGCILKFSGWFL